MLDKLKVFFQNKTNIILVAVLVLIIGGGIFTVNRFVLNRAVQLPLEEIDLPFDPEGTYALLIPRRDGNALNLNMFRVSSYEGVFYELAYQATGTTAGDEFGEGPIDRGVQGTLETKDKKSEFQQEILFGTCSQGYTTGESHCVFDQNVENGTLTLRIKQTPEKGAKVQKVYKMVTAWHMQKPDVALGMITSSDKQFTYKTAAPRTDLTTVGYTIVHDLTGAPKLPEGKKVFGRVYAFNAPIAKIFPAGDVTMEYLEKAPDGAKIFFWQDKDNKWTELDTKVDGGKLSAKAPSAGIFAVLVSK